LSPTDSGEVDDLKRKAKSKTGVKKDSELFRPLVQTAEGYLRDYCDGKEESDEKAKIALRILSLHRRILRMEKERNEIKSEWERLLRHVTELKKFSKRRSKRGKQRLKKE
jgi:hypothetical protein